MRYLTLFSRTGLLALFLVVSLATSTAHATPVATTGKLAKELGDLIKPGSEPEDKLQALQKLAQNRTPESAEIVLSIVANPGNPYILKVAGQVLETFRNPECIAYFIQEYKKAKARDVRFTLLRALALFGDPSSVGVLLKAATDKEYDFRAFSVNGLGIVLQNDHNGKNPQRKEILATVTKAINDPASYVRERACDVAHEIKDPQFFEPLLAALSSKLPGLAEAAERALSAYEDASSQSQLLSQLIESKNPAERSHLIYVLGIQKYEPALSTLFELSGSQVEDLRISSAIGLAVFATPEALEKLSTLATKDKAWAVRAAAISALGRTRAPNGKSAVLLGFVDPAWQVRAAAYRAARRIRHKDYLNPLFDRLTAEDEGILVEEITKSLKNLTGWDWGTDPKGWLEWWKTAKENWADEKSHIVDENRSTSTTSHAGKVYKESAKNYGIRTSSKKIVFVIDVSLSMNESAGLPTNVTGRKTYKSNLKFEIAKQELIESIEEMQDGVQFNIIVFETLVSRFSDGLVKGDKKGKAKAIEFVEKLKPGDTLGTTIDGLHLSEEASQRGNTNIWGALSYAITKSGADTVYFLTDGDPTAGIHKDQHVILNEFSKLSHVNQVVIHTIAIGNEAARDLLKLIAAESEGKFVDVNAGQSATEVDEDDSGKK